jgi:hypothetical protein
MDRHTNRRMIWILGLLAMVAVAGAVVVATWGITGSSASGDPGGQVMDQLTPTATALPGYGTVALPWVSELPQSPRCFVHRQTGAPTRQLRWESRDAGLVPGRRPISVPMEQGCVRTGGLHGAQIEQAWVDRLTLALVRSAEPDVDQDPSQWNESRPERLT